MEIHYGEVTDNFAGKPEMRGAIKVRCLSLFPDGRELPDPVKPSFQMAGAGWGIFCLPEVGDIVELEVEELEDGSLDVRWRAGVYGEGDLPSIFKENYGKRWGIVDPAGNYIYLDYENNKIVIYQRDGNKIELNQEMITLEQSGGGIIVLKPGKVVLMQGDRWVARRGDYVECPCGVAPIIEGNPKILG